MPVSTVNDDSVAAVARSVPAPGLAACALFRVQCSGCTLVIFKPCFTTCFLLHVSEVCCPRCKYATGIKLAWYFFFFGGGREGGSFKENDPFMSIFNTLHSLFLWC